MDLRIVIKISRADDESLKASFYSIDQNPTPINANSCALKGSSLKISISQMNGTYEGTVSSDGKSIAGNWSQGGPATPLNLVRATAETAWDHSGAAASSEADVGDCGSGLCRRHCKA